MPSPGEMSGGQFVRSTGFLTSGRNTTAHLWVVSNCALRDKKRDTPVSRNAPYLNNAFVNDCKEISPVSQAPCCLLPEMLSPELLPPGSAVLSGLFSPVPDSLPVPLPCGVLPVIISFQFLSFLCLFPYISILSISTVSGRMFVPYPAPSPAFYLCHIWHFVFWSYPTFSVGFTLFSVNAVSILPKQKRYDSAHPLSEFPGKFSTPAISFYCCFAHFITHFLLKLL